MKAMRLLVQFFLCLAFLFAGAGAPQAETGTVPGAAASQQVPQSNGEIRQWYNDQVAVIPALDQQWIRQGLSAEERARKAQEIRHHARLQARAYMQDKAEVADLQARDREKYGDPDGPTFAYLVQKNREKGLQGDAVFEDIIGSSNRTNAEYNAKFNVKPASSQ